MAAKFIKISDPPPTFGGEYEFEVRQTLAKRLPEDFIIIGGASLATKQSYFYDYDLIIFGPDLCEIIEVKRIHGSVKVFEDWLESGRDFRISQVFSILENKARVLANRLTLPPFSWKDKPWVSSRLLIGPEPEITFDYKEHKANNKVVTLQELIQYYKTIGRESSFSKNKFEEWTKIKHAWDNFSNKLEENRRGRHELGHFIIRKRITSHESHPEYLAIDEPPCKAAVHLKEFPFDSVVDPKEFYRHIGEMTREMQILRRLRHPYVHCVIGHFQTGCSLVQVSDWFEGSPLEKNWQEMTKLFLPDKIDLMAKITQGMAYCHSKGVFHRNINAINILVSDSFDDVRITGFDFAKDLELGNTLTKKKMEDRDRRIIPPEELVKTDDLNYRLYDIYQTGLLFYRIIENGAWPFDNTTDYLSAKGLTREFSNHKKEKGFKKIESLINKMIHLEPEKRPDTMLKIEGILNDIIAAEF